ncbi:MAG: calcium-binding protein [Paracoccaceae bacterium]
MADKRPDLVLFVADVSARTQFITQNEAHIDTLPFDGIAVNIPQSWSAMSPDVSVTRADLEYWLEPLRSFNQGRNNWLTIEVDDPGDVFDDAAWARVVDNWRLMAEVARNLGFEGILFDNEQYQGKWQNWPEDYPPEAVAIGQDAYQAQTSLRGKQIAEAVASVWSDAKIGFAHGPYISVDPEPGRPTQTGGAELYELYGPFFTGFAEGAGPAMRMVDGGEIYALRTAEEFQWFQDWRSNTVPQKIDWAVDPDLIANWDSRIDHATMVYTDEWPIGTPQTPDSLTSTLLNAFDNSEGTVYLYNERAHIDWLTAGQTPQEWLDAVSRAVWLADHTTRGGAGADKVTGDALDNRLVGGAGNDHLQGQDGLDWLVGDAGSDVLWGGYGADDIFGGAGRDRLNGGVGNDKMEGGAESDTFILRSTGGNDTVTDFDPITDRIDVIGEVSGATASQTADGLLVTYQGGTLLLQGVTGTTADLTLI